MAAPQFKAVLFATPQMRSEPGLTFRSSGTAEFIGALEKKMLRRLKLLKGGRPGKPSTDSRQSELIFGA
jgi:hypothetical protein